MKNLSVTIVQADLHWENPVANLAMLEELLWGIKEKTDLIILPEMFTTGFSMKTSLAEHTGLTTLRWLRQQAAQRGAVITGSYMVKENDKFYNRLAWVDADGYVDYYDKGHLFSMADEHQFFTAGNKTLVKTVKGWRISPFICYDLRFPTWSYNIEKQAIKYDCLLYVANFPEVRANVWNTLLRARAIENWSYCIGVNRVGIDGKGISYVGESAVINAKGNTIFEAGNQVCVQTIELNWAELQEYRAKFPAYVDVK
jgi:omega-amidase